MKKIFIILFLSVFAVLPMMAQNKALPSGTDAPALVGKDTKGNDVSLDALKGKYVLIDFWATWCKPCRAGFPHLKGLYEKYSGKDFDILMVSVDEDQEPWAALIDRGYQGIDKYKNLLANGQEEAYGVVMVPMRYLIAPDGKIVSAYDDEQQLDAKLAEIFGE